MEGGLDFSLLPAELQHLRRLIEKYGQSDDDERTQGLEAASTDELRELLEAVSPHWDLLDSFYWENEAKIGPSQDLALALGAFTEAAAEARIYLHERAS
jgi:hypothetical protein